MDSSEDGDFLLVDRIRYDNAEQFYNLVRMHLSFVLDLNTEECDNNIDKKSRQLKWNLPFLKKLRPPKLDGNHLTNDVVNQIQKLIEYLSIPENIQVEGIFRRTGKLKRQQELKSKLAVGEDVDLSSGAYSVHDCASVLKNYLSEFPEPILTETHYPAYCQVAELTENEHRLLAAIQLLVLLLPHENYNLLRKILTLLNLAAHYEEKNRMSPQNLATLFTPHLLCPRRLSPEILHQQSQVMSKVVAFMIEQSEKVFHIPAQLATDAKAYWTKKERKKCQSPVNQMNESVCDGTTVTTVFTFVDRERTAQENCAGATEVALAELYAHIQSLPESAMKRRLVKQFNKRNGGNTPVGAVRKRSRSRSRAIRDSIKKHLSSFGKHGKESPMSNMPKNDLEEEPTRNKMKTPLMPVDQVRLNRPLRRINQELQAARQPLRATENKKIEMSSDESSSSLLSSSSSGTSGKPGTRTSRKSQENEKRAAKRTSPVAHSSIIKVPNMGPPPATFETPINTSLSRGGLRGIATSTPAGASAGAVAVAGTGSALLGLHRTNSMSPITRSAQRMSRAMQETMMTPRSRKPVVSLSGSDLCHLTADIDPWTTNSEASEGKSTDHSGSLSTTFRDYLFSRSVLNASPVDLSFSSRTDDYQSLSDKNSSIIDEEEENKGLSVDNILKDEVNLTDSLLYCLDGNDPKDINRSAYCCAEKICETTI